MIICDKCGKENSELENVCSNCGNELWGKSLRGPPKKRSRSSFFAVILVLAVAAAILVALSYAPLAQEELITNNDPVVNEPTDNDPVTEDPPVGDWNLSSCVVMIEVLNIHAWNVSFEAYLDAEMVFSGYLSPGQEYRAMTTIQGSDTSIVYASAYASWEGGSSSAADAQQLQENGAILFFLQI